MPRSYSHNATAAIGNEVQGRVDAHGPAPAAIRRTPIYIVTSPRPQVGKTFIARLLIDFLRFERSEPIAFDLNPGGDALRDYLPRLAVLAEIEDTSGQMALFDRLILADSTPKVVDVGSGAFKRFFTVMQEIHFLAAAPRVSIEPIVLFIADAHPVAVAAYADLQRRFPDMVLVPVFNEADPKDRTKDRRLRDGFPFTRTATVPLEITALSPALKAQVEKAHYSFGDVHDELPLKIPIGPGYELRAWTRRTFVEFRELELRLLLEQLRASMENPLVAE